MAELWPFKPEEAFVEELSWSTDVQETQSTEYRTSRRDSRQALEYECRLSAEESARAELLFSEFGTGDWFVPDWTNPYRTGPLSNADTIVPADSDAMFEPNGKAVIFESNSRQILVDIASIGADQITLSAPLGEDFLNPVILPVRTGYSIDGYSHTRSFSNDVTGSIRFSIRDPYQTAASTYPSFMDLDVLADPSWSISPISGRIFHNVTVVDSDLGPVELVPARSVVESTFALNALHQNTTERRIWREWLNSIRGRDKSFWHMTRAKELLAISPIGASDTSIMIAPSSLDIAAYVGRYIALNGTFFRRINGAFSSPTQLQLSIDPLGVSLTDPEISFLTKYRFDTDVIRIEHRHNQSFTEATLREVHD